MKKIFGLILTVCVAVSAMSPAVFATRYDSCAEALNYMGVFKGTSTGDYTDYELDRGAKRVEALVMLIRLLGEEADAVACQSSHHFVDVPMGHWAYSYVAYAYEKGYTAGVSATEFSPNAEVNLKAFVTFLLRALGYNDANGDFDYGYAIEKAEELGLLINGTYENGNDICLRDDCAYLSARAFNTKKKNSDKLLAEDLISKGVIPADSVERIKQALTVADKEITDAYISGTSVKVEDVMTYGEYVGGNAVKRMQHIAYYNPYAKTLLHYEYDAYGNVIKETSTDSAASPTTKEYFYDNRGALMGYDEYYLDDFAVVGDLKYDIITYADDMDTVSFERSASNGKVTGIFINEGANGSVSIEYNGATATVRLNAVSVDQFENLNIFLPAVNKVVIYDEYGKLGLTKTFNNDGVLVSEYDANNRPVYIAEVNRDGKLIKETYYTYMWESESAFFDAASGSDTCTTYDYSYDANGKIKTVRYVDKTQNIGGDYSFRYFGNGKLDRVLFRWDDDSTWEQAYTAFDEYGHIKAPY